MSAAARAAAPRAAAALLAVATAGAAGFAAGAEGGGGGLERFFGSYVGLAEETAPDGQVKARREIDVDVGASGRDGVSVTWTNVTLVDGRRDVPGVRRRVDEVLLAPASPGRDLYTARAPYDPFSERHPPDAIAGEPLRWARIEGDTLRTYSVVILDDGRYELQTYDRRLTREGLDLGWRRVVDGETVRRMTGRAVRAD